MVNQPTQTEVKQITEREFYTTHSTNSNPGKYAHLLENLPADYAGVSRVVQGLIYHYMAGQYIYGYCPPQERMAEIDTRFMERMLGRIMELDSRPLSEPRAFEKRLVGCCRDFSLLTCAILRQHGIPARLRYGFGSYFVSGYWIDHVIVEAWNGSRWQRFDSQVTNGSDKLDLPESDFVTGGRAWQMIRNEGADAALFGLGPGVPELSGAWFIRGRLRLDVAALNKQEMLCWDEWGIGISGEDQVSAEQETLLDQAAALSVQADIAPLQALSAASVELRVPQTVRCYSPTNGPHEAAV
jgi:hypothetical protein